MFLLPIFPDHLGPGASSDYFLGDAISTYDTVNSDIVDFNSERYFSCDGTVGVIDSVQFAPSVTLFFSGHFVREGSFPSNLDTSGFIQFKDSSGNINIALFFNSNGTIRIVNGDNQLLATTSASVSILTKVHFEIKMVCNGVSGEFHIKINGGAAESWTGIDTKQGTAAAEYASVTFKGTGTGAYLLFRDIMIWNDSGTEWNDWMGVQGSRLRDPDGDTAQADWTRSAGTTNSENVDETPIDGDTSYVQSNTSGHKDEYTLENTPAEIGTITGVVVFNYAKKTTTGTQSQKLIADDGTTEQQGVSKFMTEDYRHYLEFFPDNGVSSWTPGVFDGTVAGMVLD